MPSTMRDDRRDGAKPLVALRSSAKNLQLFHWTKGYLLRTIIARHEFTRLSPEIRSPRRCRTCITSSIPVMKLHRLIPAIAFASFAIAPMSRAQEGGDRPAENPEQKEQHAREQRERGEHGDRANERLTRMKREVEELQNAGKQEEANQLRRRLEAALQQQQAEGRRGEERRANERRDGDRRADDRRSDAPSRPNAGFGERIQHLQQAIRHLQAAGMQDQARELEKIGQQMQEEFRRNAAREREESRRDGESQREVEELRAQVQKLSREVQELRDRARADRGAAERAH